MGNSNSNQSNNYSKNTAQVYNVAPQYTDHQTINFSRNDLIGTISALSISPLSTSELVGGGIPRRNRYSQYESSVKPSKQSGGSGVTTFSSVSSTDLNDIKNMIIGGGDKCGCETQMCGGGSESSYNPLNSMSSQSFMHGSGCGCGNGSCGVPPSFNAFSATSPIQSEANFTSFPRTLETSSTI